VCAAEIAAVEILDLLWTRGAYMDLIVDHMIVVACKGLRRDNLSWILNKSAVVGSEQVKAHNILGTLLLMEHSSANDHRLVEALEVWTNAAVLRDREDYKDEASMSLNTANHYSAFDSFKTTAEIQQISSSPHKAYLYELCILLRELGHNLKISESFIQAAQNVLKDNEQRDNVLVDMTPYNLQYFLKYGLLENVANSRHNEKHSFAYMIEQKLQPDSIYSMGPYFSLISAKKIENATKIR